MSPRPRVASDRGAVSAMVAILAFAILAGLGLVVAGGRALGALSEAQDIADNAARAGSQAVDLELWRTTGRPVIDRPAAEAAVARFMDGSRLGQRIDGWRIVDAPAPDADITVAVEVSVTTTRFIFPERTITAIGSANALDGVADP